MKRITLLLAFISMIALQSCTVNDTAPAPVQTDNDTISEVLEYTVSFNSGNNYKKSCPEQGQLFFAVAENSNPFISG